MQNRTILILIIFGFLTGCNKTEQNYLTDLVDPFIGTAATGNTYPGASLPFGMIQLSPDTEIDKACSGYHYTDETIIGFSHTHLSGTGVADFGDILLMPTVGEVKIQIGTTENPESGYRSRFTHDREFASPGYYSVMLDDYNVKVELTSTNRVGFHKYTFPKSEESHIIIDIQHDIASHDNPLEDCFIRVISDTEVEGLRHSRGWASDQYVYFVAKFSEPFEKSNLYLSDLLVDDNNEIKGNNVKASLNFHTDKDQAIKVKVGISAVDIEGARKNLNSELNHWDFNKIVDESKNIWEKELSKIKVEGGSAENRIKFYTAFYHSLLTPNLYSDVDGKYRGMDHKIHEGEGFDYYHVFSLWDTYRAVNPFFNIVCPERNTDFIKTMIKQYEHSGLLPIWELGGCENNCMIGYHSIPVIADAFLKGNRDFDIEKAFEAMVNSATQNSEGVPAYRKYKYIPIGFTSNTVSKTLEYAYDDWCIAQVAKEIGRETEYKEYIKRSQYYQNHFDSATGLMRPRFSDGTWREPFDPLRVSMLDAGDYTEANAWHYSFYVPQNIPHHIELMGGDENYSHMLDTFFTLESNEHDGSGDFFGKFGQYAHGNEPSHHMPYLYNYTGLAWKTQEMVRKTMNELYTTEPDGLCGNDDCGQLSCWYLFSAMGFYPVNPGQDMYVIGSPIFNKITINLPNGNNFIITSDNCSEEYVYINNTKMNGENYPYSFIKHSDLMEGGEISFTMDSEPNKLWGKEKENRPFAVPIEPENKLPQLGIEKVFNPYAKSKNKIFTRSALIELGSISNEIEIYYTLDGSKPDKQSIHYLTPIKINTTTCIKAIAYKEGLNPSDIAEHWFYKSNLDSRKSKIEVKYLPPLSGKNYFEEVVNGNYSPRYQGSGELSLVDGILGTSHFSDGDWQGFEGKDVTIVIDLINQMEIKNITAGFLQSIGVWIFYPELIEFSVSKDGKKYKTIGKFDNKLNKNSLSEGIKYFTKHLNEKNIRFIKIFAKNVGICPEWHEGRGGKGWIFMDEIIVE